eukprot:5471970-Amphidinium_carterae.2
MASKLQHASPRCPASSDGPSCNHLQLQDPRSLLQAQEATKWIRTARHMCLGVTDARSLI